MKEIIADKSLASYCGLYCGACRRYLNDSCPGCPKNDKASWCKVRMCCIEKKYLTCSDCKEINNLSECTKLNNLISKIFSLIFQSDRIACLNFIKEKGIDEFVSYMTQNKIMTIKR
ncbi:MAG: DUF3795 domain-containing protein [Desulfobacterales bacterium]|nr:DUF3795 domain-containing protein [Desulfobacterales bacterium]